MPTLLGPLGPARLPVEGQEGAFSHPHCDQLHAAPRAAATCGGWYPRQGPRPGSRPPVWRNCWAPGWSCKQLPLKPAPQDNAPSPGAQPPRPPHSPRPQLLPARSPRGGPGSVTLPGTPSPTSQRSPTRPGPHGRGEGGRGAPSSPPSLQGPRPRTRSQPKGLAAMVAPPMPTPPTSDGTEDTSQGGRAPDRAGPSLGPQPGHCRGCQHRLPAQPCGKLRGPAGMGGGGAAQRDPSTLSNPPTPLGPGSLVQHPRPRPPAGPGCA